MTLPVGYSPIPGGTFTPHGAGAQVTVAPFGMARTPVTNAQYGALSQSLGEDRFVLLEHDFESGATSLVRRSATAEAPASDPAYTPEWHAFDKGDALIFGSQILLKMVDNPSAQFDEAIRLFSGSTHPALGLSYFHAKAWCLLKSLEDGGAYHYDLPTDVQYEYVASNRGTQEYGTETGTLHADGRKLAHIDEYNYGEGTTVTVDDPRYEQRLPLDVQTTGNVWRWIQMNPAFKQDGDFSYGLRGGAFNFGPDYGRAAFRNHGARPSDRGRYVGFSPVVVPQDSGAV